ncbi:hypothetical protein H206_05643 [Candidatus Electrothrix aarhusensis]|uniref:Uncharacterized protein n=1 Tax=Candidatus Electrothrix aarhusensis TaxID=1859131 RepID=A0A444J3V4_9BACT|nr:hypothetical protein H206_05643 [Candidatus Electrothrix aarhusensis]
MFGDNSKRHQYNPDGLCHHQYCLLPCSCISRDLDRLTQQPIHHR